LGRFRVVWRLALSDEIRSRGGPLLLREGLGGQTVDQFGRASSMRLNRADGEIPSISDINESDSMIRTVVGVIVATVVLYMWGFVYWSFGPYKTQIWKQSPNDVAAGNALRDLFPENGTYLVPGFGNAQQNREELSNTGPVVMVHMLAVRGMPGMDPKTLLFGFELDLVVIALIALVLRRVAPSLPTYFDRVKFVTLIGLAAAVLIDVGDITWWHIDWQWKLYQAFYDVSFWVLTGLVLGLFVKPKAV
jgi:hypothetical protein